MKWRQLFLLEHFGPLALKLRSARSIQLYLSVSPLPLGLKFLMASILVTWNGLKWAGND